MAIVLGEIANLLLVFKLFFGSCYLDNDNRKSHDAVRVHGYGGGGKTTLLRMKDI